MEILYENLLAFQWQDIVMILLGCLLIFLAIKKEMEPSLLLPLQQALAIAARYGNAELSIGYADSGSGTVSAQWLIHET